jgi:hypothetical protein
MPHDRGRSCIAALLVLLAICGDGQCNPPEPQATFVLKQGWVKFAVRKDGRPVGNVTIEIIDENGVRVASGDTGPESETEFPLPPGASFVVEIKVGDRTADPIRLFKSGRNVEPGRVLLSYGLRPCCRSIKTRDEATVGTPIETPTVPSEEPTRWHLLVPVFAGVLIAGLVAFVFWRRPPWRK